MKQQNEENTELYRRLRGSFEMSPEQMQRVRQEILQRTGGENAVPASITQHRVFSGRTLAKRLIPAAACLLLAVGGGIFLHFRSAELTDSFTQQSSVMMDEVTAVMTETTTTAGQTTTRQTTTLTMTTTQTTEQTRMQTTELMTGQMTEQFTDIETEAVQTEMNDVTQLQYETESVTDAQETTSVSVSTTVTAITTTTTQPVTTEPKIRPEKYELLVENVTGSPGDIVEIGIVIPQEIAFAGFQMCELMSCDLDGPIVCTEIDSISDKLLYCAQDQRLGMSCNFTFAQGQNIELPAGSTLLTLKCRIPSHAEPGSIFTIDIESAKFVTEDDVELTIEISNGSITVI